MEASQYPYTPLDAEKREIRVLKACKAFGARPDAPDDLLALSMTIISLEQPSHPRFNTLSYVWGDPVFDHHVNIDGARVGVTANLHLALTQIFASGTNAYWWTDAICIDQANIEERGSQVGFMDIIYGHSVNTVAHLGSFKPTKAFRLITIIAAHLKNPYPERGVIKVFQDPGYLSFWQCLEEFFRQPYWTRAWILQELVVPRKVRFLDIEGPWMDAAVMVEVFRAVRRLSDLNIGRDRDGNPAPGWIVQNKVSLGDPFLRIWEQMVLRNQYWMTWESPCLPELMHVLLVSLKLVASDPRDHLYSVVSMVKDGHEIIGTPRYDQSLHILFASFVQHFYRKYLLLDMILLNGFERQVEGLPTWVPDLTSFEGKHWRNTLLQENLMRFKPEKVQNGLRYHASATSAGEATFSPNLIQLRVIATRMGSVSGLGAWTATFLREPGRSSGPEILHPLQQDDSINELPQIDEPWEALAHCLLLGAIPAMPNDPPRHPLGPSLRKALYEVNNNTLSSHYLGYTQKWWQSNEDLRIGERSLRSLLLDGYNAQLEARKLEAMLEDDEFNLEVTTPSRSDRLAERLLSRMTHVTIEMGRRLLVTTEGRLGLAPSVCALGDEVWIIHGCTLPVILRRVYGGDRDYTLVGECYLHGVMQGEALKLGYPEQKITLH